MDGFLGMKIHRVPKLIGFPAFPYLLLLCQVRLGTFQRFSKRVGFNSAEHHQGGGQGLSTQVQAGARDDGLQAEETPHLPSHVGTSQTFKGEAGVVLTTVCGAWI